MTELDAALAALRTYEPTGDESEDVLRLDEILEPLPGDPATTHALAPVLLALAERHPQAALGTPGPVIRRLDAHEGLRPLLRDSLLRAPSELTARSRSAFLGSYRIDRSSPT